MITRFSLTPLLHNAITFNHLDGLFKSLEKNVDVANGYPAYNIEKLEGSKYRIALEVPGFSQHELNVVVQDDTLTVSGVVAANTEKPAIQYLHQGIAKRTFERNFQLVSHTRVNSASLQDGLLQIELVHEVPEEKKPQMVAIQTPASSGNVIETRTESTPKLH